jgi:hypothetical protein
LNQQKAGPRSNFALVPVRPAKTKTGSVNQASVEPFSARTWLKNSGSLGGLFSAKDETTVYSHTKIFFTRSATACLSLSPFLCCSFPEAPSLDFASTTNSSSSMSIDRVMSTSDPPNRVKLEGSVVGEDVDGRPERTDCTEVTKAGGVLLVFGPRQKGGCQRRVVGCVEVVTALSVWAGRV